jgi:hypothetical protein
LEALGGLNDWSIVGGGDNDLARAILGATTPESATMLRSAFAHKYEEFRAQCQRHLGGELGYVGTTIAHFWHGRRRDRSYLTRWQALADHAFDPNVDLVRDGDGLYRFSGNKPRLQEAIFDYFRSRDEDATEL